MTCLSWAGFLGAQTPRDFAIDLSAAVSTNAPCITLNWTIRRQGNIMEQKVHRRLKGENVWVKQADLATNQTSYADNTAVPGIEYEYWMERTYTGIYPTTAMGYLSSGVNVPMSDFRGKLLLVVDSTMASPLAVEIAQLQADLTGDGWLVQTITATRTASAISTKALIQAAYEADPANVKMVYLLGHVPVPYSGNSAPDGHSSHVGAWPADGYYGDMDGLWTDTSVNDTSAADTRNRNIPGDGKFDQSNLPSPVELMVGRVDLANMTRAPSSAASETSLLRRYLRKAHDYRFKQGAYAAIPRRSIVRDGLGYYSGENFAIEGWGWFFSGVGSLVDEPPSDQWFLASYAGGKSYLVGCGNGSGSWDAASTVGNSVDFGLKTNRVVFTTFFGSFLGDWDSANNFMRAPLAGNATGDSLGLACFWGGRPNLFMHHMGLGETIGYSMRISQNSSLSGGGNYQPNSYAGVHMGLMGDPALRLHVVEPPRNVSATRASNRVTLAWSASTETNLLGYLVYRADAETGPFARLTPSPQASNAFTDSTITASQNYTYLVRTVKLETSPGGTYENPSVGSPVTLTAYAGASSTPANPTSLAVTLNSATNAQLTWVDNASNETGFRIERKTTAGGSYASVGTVGVNVTNFMDPGVFTQGNVYYYHVIASGSSTNSAPSPEAAFEAVAGFFDMPVTRVKVSKTAGTATVSVSRFGGATGPASVSFATIDTSAIAGVHYTATNGTLVWADGETGAKSIRVPIINTASPQAARQFKVTLSSPSSGTGLTVNSNTAVLIEDPTATLGAPWSQTIIGGLTDSSSAVLSGGELCSVTIGGSGVSSGSTAESGQFVYQSRTGDGELTAFFPAGLPSDGNACYALMARASTANNAIMAAAATSASTSFGSLLSVRALTGGSTSVLPANANMLTLARWMRLARSGNVFTAETSSDGSSWSLLGTATLASMPETALWGIFHMSTDWSVTELGNYHLDSAQNLTLAELSAPAIPTGLVAVASSSVSVALTWASVANATGYRVERRFETGSFSQLVDVFTASGTTQAYADTNVTADTVYAYRVSAYNASGSSDPSAVASVATPPADITAVFTTDGAGCADATVRRDLPGVPLGTQTNLAVAGYDPDSWAFLTNAAKTYLRFDLTGAGTFTTAKLKLSYVNSSRFETVGDVIGAGFYRMYIGLLSESSDTWSEGSITWTNAPQNNLTGVGFTGSVTWLDYDYRDVLPSPGEVVSFDLPIADLNSGRGANNLITIGITDYNGGALMEWASREHPSYAPPTLELSISSPLPSRPSFFTAALGTGWSVMLNWLDNATNETGFVLERRVLGGTFERVQALPRNSASAVDAPTAPETTYEYRVCATNSSGNSSWAQVVSVTTPDFLHAVGTLWDAGGSDTLVSTPSNWDADSSPPFGGSAYFNFGLAGSTATINTNVGFLGMSVYRDADFTFADGGGTLTLGAGGLRAAIPNTTSRTYTLAANVSLAADQNWGVTNNGSGVTSLLVSGPVTDGASVFGITKTGGGVLTLAGNSSYDGPTVVATGGVLRVAHDNALGSTNGATTVMNGAWLEVSGNVTVPEPLTLSGDAAVGSLGTLRSTAGTNVWSGAITQSSATRIRALGGSKLTLSGGLTGAASLYLVSDTNASLNVSGLPLKVGSGTTVYANGAGTVGLGAAGNIWGTLEVAGLTARLDAANALPAASILSVGSSYSPSGTVDLNGNDQTVSQLKRGTTGAGSRLVTSAAPAALTVSGSTSTTYDGLLTGALSLIKAGTSTLTLIGTNTYSGATVVSNGTLYLSAGTSLRGSLDVTVAGGTLSVQSSTDGLADTATLRIADGGAKVSVKAGVVETVGALYLGGSRKAKGTWGGTGSGADNIDSAHFTGTGVINVPTGTSTAWDGGGSNTYVNTANNWDYDKSPAFDGSAYLTFGLGGATATVNTNVSFLGLCLNRDSDFAIADGGAALTLGAGGLLAAIPNATSRVYTVAANIALATNQTWAVTNNGAGVATLVVSGPVSDGASAFGLTKTGDGVLTLAGNSSYDGPTVIATGGVLRVAHANALGSTNGATTVMNGGWLEVTGNVSVAEALTINGDAAVGSAGTLRSTFGTNVWAGAITLGSASRIRALSGSVLTLAGGLTGTATVFLVSDANAVLKVSGLPLKVASSNVYANGSGTVVLGTTGNTWGTLEVAGLTLRTDIADVLPAASILSVGSSYSPNGVVDLNGTSQTVSQLKRGTTGAGSRIVTSAAPATLTVSGSTASMYDGLLTGALSLVKAGTSILTLSGTNTYSGATLVSNGTLLLSAGSSLRGSLDVTVAGGTLSVQSSTDGLADTATLRVADGGAKVSVQAGVVETVGVLYLGGKRQPCSTYGATGSGAAHIDSAHFSGTGVIKVLHGPETIILVK